MVYLQYSVFHGEPLDSLFQFVVEYSARIVEILIIYTYRQNEMSEQQFWNILSPCHLLLCLHAHSDIIEEELRLVVGNVSQRHIFIQEVDSFSLFSGKPFQFSYFLPSKFHYSVFLRSAIVLYFHYLIRMVSEGWRWRGTEY